MPCDDCSRADSCPPCVNEPDGSASSSPDEHQHCWHYRSEIPGDECCVCEKQRLDGSPAGAETAGEPEPCYCDCAPAAHTDHNNGCEKHGAHEFIRKSFAPDESLPEPEALEEPGPTELAPCTICGNRRKTNAFRAGLFLCESCIYGEGQPYCGGCGSKEAPFGLVSHEGEDKFNELRCAKCLLPPRRPPYAVAYVLQDGTHFEVALPGDATVCALDGALLITHTQSPVQGLTQARPMEGA